MDEQARYDQVAFYTMAHPGPGFIHQNLVDAFAAQNAAPDDKPIKAVFTLVGLYLCLEKGYTGRQAQLAHMKMARRRKDWPRLSLPAQRGTIRIGDVLAAPPGPERDARIAEWGRDVWQSWSHAHGQIRELCQNELGVEP